MVYFDLMYLVMQDFFLVSKLYVSLEISLELIEIYKFCDLDLTFESVILYVTSVGLAIIWYGPLRRGCNFLEIPF